MIERLLYNQELAEEVCQRLAEGETLLAICRDIAANDRQFPQLKPHHIREWAREYKEFGEQYGIAMTDGADALIDQMQAIAENPTLTEIITEKWAGGRKEKLLERTIKTVDNIERDKLRILVRQYRARMQSPRVQNIERKSLSVTGDGEGSAVAIEIRGGLPARPQDGANQVPVLPPKDPTT